VPERIALDATRRDARVALTHTRAQTVYVALPMRPRTFIAIESEFLLYAGSHSVLLPRSSSLLHSRPIVCEMHGPARMNRRALRTGFLSELARAEKHRKTSSHFCIHIRRAVHSALLVSANRIPLRRLSAHLIAAARRPREVALTICEIAIIATEKLSDYGSFASLSVPFSSRRPFGDRYICSGTSRYRVGSRMYRNNHDRSSRAFRPRAARFFDTF